MHFLTVSRPSLFEVAFLKMFEPVDNLYQKEPGVTLAKFNLVADYTEIIEVLDFRNMYTTSIMLFERLRELQKEPESADLPAVVAHLVRVGDATKDARSSLEKFDVERLRARFTAVDRQTLLDELDANSKKVSADMTEHFEATLKVWEDQLVWSKMPDWYAAAGLFLPDLAAQGGVAALKSISQLAEPNNSNIIKRMAAQLQKKNILICVEFAEKFNKMMLLGAGCSLAVGDFKTLDPAADVDPASVKDVPADPRLLANFVKFVGAVKEMKEFYNKSQDSLKALRLAEEGVPSFVSYFSLQRASDVESQQHCEQLSEFWC
jgi:hypothetical protein